jgi:hypothetical protein
MVATRISPPWDELCRLEPIGMNFRQRRQWRDTKKHGNIFDGILSMVYINGMLMVYIIWDVIWEH